METEGEQLPVFDLISSYRKVSEALNADQNKHGCNTKFGSVGNTALEKEKTKEESF